MIEITFTEKGLWDTAVYFIGLYSQLTNKQIALIEVKASEIEIYKDTIINPPSTIFDLKFKVPKQKFSDRIQEKLKLLEKFMLQQCVFNEKF